MRGRGWWMVPAVVLLAGMMSGCSAVSKAPQDASERAWNMTPPEGKALVYVVRPAATGRAVMMFVTCDGVDVGKTGGQRFIYAVLDPGGHVFVSRAENKSELPIVLEAGKTYYLEQKVTMGLLMARNKLLRLDDTEGRKKLLKCSLSSQTAAEAAPAAPATK